MEWAYVAGFLDGDGCIALFTRYNKISIEPRLIFGNTNKDILNALHNFFQCGYIGLHSPKGYGAKYGDKQRKDDYHALSVTRMAKIKWILENCLPYLIVKKRQAELMLKFIALREKANANMRRPRGTTTYGPEETLILGQMRSINIIKHRRKGYQRKISMPFCGNSSVSYDLLTESNPEVALSRRKESCRSCER